MHFDALHSSISSLAQTIPSPIWLYFFQKMPFFLLSIPPKHHLFLIACENAISRIVNIFFFNICWTLPLFFAIILSVRKKKHIFKRLFILHRSINWFFPFSIVPSTLKITKSFFRLKTIRKWSWQSEYNRTWSNSTKRSTVDFFYLS